MNPKYIVVRDEFDREGAILIPERIKHIEAAFYFHRSGMVISAGFYHITHDAVAVYGRSESLSIGSRPEDVKLIAELLGIKERSETA